MSISQNHGEELMSLHERLSRRGWLRLGTGSALTLHWLGSAVAVADAADGHGPRFGAVADCQYADAPTAGTRHYRASPEKLRAAVDEWNTMPLDFVIHLGDFIDRDFDSFDRVLPILGACRAKTYHVLGNHDYSVADPRKGQVPEKLGLGRTYYQFACRGWRMVVLDGNDISLHAHVADSPAHKSAWAMLDDRKEKKAPNAQTWNGAVGPQQLDWLTATLGQADQAGEKAIVFCHFPVFPPNEHNLWNDQEVIERLESHRSVVAYFNGHNHAGNYAQRRGIHYVTLEGMVETADTSAYGVVEAGPQRVRVAGRGRVPAREFAPRAASRVGSGREAGNRLSFVSKP
jgi:predicted phosphodiesterase